MVISTKSVLKQIRSLERHLNRLGIIPATNRLRSAVILPPLSKALTVSRAVCVLVDAGYRAEAFGLSRAVIEILFIVSYISNKDTERRARRYRDYDARARVEFLNIAKKYAPNAFAGSLRTITQERQHDGGLGRARSPQCALIRVILR